MLEEQCCEIQQWYEEQQQFLLQLQEAAEAHHAEHAAQKARREAEAKAKEEAKKQKITEEKKLEYIQQLQDKVLEEETTLLERAEGSQVMGSKRKEVTTRDKEGQWSSKKTREKQPGKYYRGVTVKIGGANPCKRCVYARQDCLVHS